MATEPTIAAAFVAGMLSFASPCILPLVPAFLTYIGSTGLKEGEKVSRRRIFLNAVAYVIGFTLVFSILGVLLNGILGSIAYDLRIWLSRVGGIIIIAFALYILGIIKVGFLEREHRIKKSSGGNSYLVSFIFGASFAVGWTPCVGAILGAILTLAATLPGQSFALLLSYSLGLGLPFLAAGAFVAQSQQAIRKLAPYMKYFNYVAGALLLVLGVLVFTDNLSRFAEFGLAQFYVGS